MAWGAGYCGDCCRYQARYGGHLGDPRFFDHGPEPAHSTIHRPGPAAVGLYRIPARPARGGGHPAGRQTPAAGGPHRRRQEPLLSAAGDPAAGHQPGDFTADRTDGRSGCGPAGARHRRDLSGLHAGRGDIARAPEQVGGRRLQAGVRGARAPVGAAVPAGRGAAGNSHGGGGRGALHQ